MLLQLHHANSQQTATPKPATEITVLLDRYFNSEKRKDDAGNMQYWHYTWEERADPGFYAFGQLFKHQGAQLATLDHAPTATDLDQAGIYIIVDPDHLKDNPLPNYITAKETKPIVDWVKRGGVLVLMANDSANCDLQHLNQLAEQFGIHYTDKSVNLVKGDEFETGVVQPLDTSIFKESYKMFLKDISVLSISGPAKAVAMKNGDVLMATAKIGKGTVFAVGDPWVYNEYLVGSRLPAEFPNHRAAHDLVLWLLQQVNQVAKHKH
jgi:unsaturated rhamnogalacturonyl hydrolase